MTVRNFDALFKPRVIALVGASARDGAVGAVLARNLLGAGFEGEILLVNPHDAPILGRPVYRDISLLPRTPDLAVIATPAASVAPLVEALGARGCRAAIVISAGDAAFRTSVLQAARPWLMRIIGPNCLGVLSPASGLNASFAQLTPDKGSIALVTQSGAIATSMLDWAHARGIGFSHLVSLGDMSDVDFGDMLDYLALDPATRSILLYVEQITNARKFMSAARIAARVKPVIVVKAGRSAAGARAATSHTGALAGADAVYDAAFRRAGMLRVDALRDLFDAAETLSRGFTLKSDRLFILTNGGGLGVLATDALEAEGGQLAELSDVSRAALDHALPAQWSHANPVDILGDAHGERYAQALEILAQQDGGAILVMNCPTGVADNADAAHALAAAHASRPGTALLGCFVGGASLEAPRSILADARIPAFEAPEDAVRAFTQLVDYARNQRALLETPAPSAEPPADARARVAATIARVQSEGRAVLTEPEAKDVLASYGIPVARTKIAADIEAAARTAQTFAGRVALKILSRDITHKSDVGGVALNLEPDKVQAAASAMLSRVGAKNPDARIDGFTVQDMIERPGAQELILGASIDPTFGPVLLFGQGGTAVEILADRAMALPPLNSSLAQDLIARTRVAKLLGGYRDRPAANFEAIGAALVSLSDLIVEHPAIAELDINPLLADAEGVIAVDARIVIRVGSEQNPAPLAISPYPSALVQTACLDDGSMFSVRPIRPADAPSLLAMAARTSRADLRLRFHAAVRADSTIGAARLCQIDYDREMAFAAIEPDGAFAGIVRIMFDPEFETGEFAVLVRSDLQGRGLGRHLLEMILSYSRSRGVRQVWGDILPENAAMLDLARRMGAGMEVAPDSVRATFMAPS